MYAITRKINLKRFFPEMEYETIDFQVEADTKEKAEQELEEWIKDWLKKKQESKANKELDKEFKQEGNFTIKNK